MPPKITIAAASRCTKHIISRTRDHVRPRRHAQFRSSSSTASTTATSPPPQPPPLPSKTKPPKSPNYRRRALLWSLTALAFGLTAGNFVAHTISPPPHPEPGSQGDKILVHDLERRIDELFKVRVLKGKCLATPARLRGEQGGWVEVSSAHAIGHGDERDRDRAEGLRQQAEALGLDHDQERRRAGMVDGAMAGARALGAERVFWNAKGKELVAVVWLGGALSGWPGVVHGGAIATLLEEKIGVAVGLLRQGEEEANSSGMSTEVEDGRRGPFPREMELMYKKPTYGNDFYMIRIAPRFAMTEGLGTVVKSMGREIEAEGKLEAMDGRVCVEMTAIVPVAEQTGSGGFAAVKAAAKSRSLPGWLT